MRIKKKNIREDVNSETSDKVDQVKAVITKTSEDFDEMGIEEPLKTAVGVVSDIVGDAMDENSGLPGTLNKDGEPIPAICMEAIRPSMTKRELVETVLGKVKSKRVIKTLKIKDLRNE